LDVFAASRHNLTTIEIRQRCVICFGNGLRLSGIECQGQHFCRTRQSRCWKTARRNARDGGVSAQSHFRPSGSSGPRQNATLVSFYIQAWRLPVPGHVVPPSEDNHASDHTGSTHILRPLGVKVRQRLAIAYSCLLLSYSWLISSCLVQNVVLLTREPPAMFPIATLTERDGRIANRQQCLFFLCCICWRRNATGSGRAQDLPFEQRLSLRCVARALYWKAGMRHTYETHMRCRARSVVQPGQRAEAAR
jgi:hypothetical protein